MNLKRFFICPLAVSYKYSKNCSFFIHLRSNHKVSYSAIHTNEYPDKLNFKINIEIPFIAIQLRMVTWEEL